MKITDCASAGCGYRCCQFQQSNYIVLYPDELDDARKTGKSIGHLNIIDVNYHGGQKAICVAGDTGNCDNGYKPLDCASYPFFPVHDGWKISTFIKGIKCPLTLDHLDPLAVWVMQQWNSLIVHRPSVAKWLTKVELVGYGPIQKKDDTTRDAA